MRRVLIVLAALTLAGCDPAGIDYTDPEDLAIAIVAGDGQVGQVQESASGAYMVASVAAQTGRYLADTLRARLTDGAGNSANVPPNTVANYSTGAGCGAPWVDDAAPDDSAYIANLWEKPAGELPDLQWHGDTLWASACDMTTRAVVDGDFVEDTIFRAYFTPGAMVQHNFRAGNAWTGTDSRPISFGPGAPGTPQDTSGNPIPWTFAVTCCATAHGTLDMTDARELTFDSVGIGQVYVVTKADTIATGEIEGWQVEDGGEVYNRVTITFP